MDTLRARALSDGGKEKDREKRVKDDKKKKVMKDTLRNMLKTGKKAKKHTVHKNIVKIVQHLVSYLEKNALQVEGLMRVSGNANKVRELKESLMASDDLPDLSSILDIHIISGAFKMIFRELPEPLLTFDLYNNFLGAFEIKDLTARVSFLRSLITTLHHPNGELLKNLLTFLHLIQNYASENKMHSANLAIVFAPTLLRPREETVQTMMTDATATTEIVKFMIDNYKALYPEAKNIPIVSIIKSEPPAAKHVEKSPKEQLEEAQAKLDAALNEKALEARERAVWEAYAVSIEEKLSEATEEHRLGEIERNSLVELINELKDQRERIQEDNERLVKEAEDWKSSANTLQYQVAESAKADAKGVAEKSAELEKAKQEAKETAKQLAELKAQMEALSKQNQQAIKDLEARTQDVTKVKKEKSDAEEKLNKEKKAVQDELENVKKVSTKLAEEHAQLKKQLDQEKDNTNKAKQDSDAGGKEKDKKIQDLQKQLETVTKEAEAAKKHKHDSEKQIKSLQDEVAELKKSSSKQEGDAKQSEGKVADLQKNLTAKTEEVVALKKQESETKSAIAEKDKKILEFQKQAETATKQLETTSKQHETSSKQLETTSKQLETTSKQLETTSKQLETTSKQLETANKQLETTKTQKQETEDKLNKQVRTLQDEIEVLKQTSAKADDKDKKIQELMKQKQEVDEKLNKQTKTQQEQTKTLQDEIATLKKHKHETEETHNKHTKTLQDEIATLKKQKQDSDDKLKANDTFIISEKEKLQKQVDTKSSEIATLQKEKQQLAESHSKVVKTLQDQLAVANSSATANASLAAANGAAGGASLAAAAAASSKQAAEVEELKKQVEKEKKSYNDLKKNLENEIERLKKSVGSSSNTLTTKPRAGSTEKHTHRKSSGADMSPEMVDELKKYLFTWITLALKFDRMSMRRVCNINASLLYERIIETNMHFTEWPSFLRVEMDKVTTDM